MKKLFIFLATISLVLLGNTANAQTSVSTNTNTKIETASENDAPIIDDVSSLSRTGATAVKQTEDGTTANATGTTAPVKTETTKNPTDVTTNSLNGSSSSSSETPAPENVIHPFSGENIIKDDSAPASDARAIADTGTDKSSNDDDVIPYSEQNTTNSVNTTSTTATTSSNADIKAVSSDAVAVNPEGMKGMKIERFDKKPAQATDNKNEGISIKIWIAILASGVLGFYLMSTLYRWQQAKKENNKE